MTSPASASRERCLAIAWRVMGRRSARSVAVAGPRAASDARMARRVGSARAEKTCSAIASMSGGIEVPGELAQLDRPAVGVAVVGRPTGIDGQLGEAGLDDLQSCPGMGTLEGELDIGAPRVVLGEVRDPPGEPEHPRLLDALDPHLDADAAREGHHACAPGAHVDRRMVAEPATEPLRRGEGGPHLVRWVSQDHGPLDPIRERHRRYPPDIATRWLQPYSNHLIASRAASNSRDSG